MIASCHTNAVARLCGGEAATFVDKYLELKLHYCYKATNSTSRSTQLGTTTQLHLLGSITQGTTTIQESITQGTVTSQDSFNGAAGIRQSTALFILFYISIFE